MSQTPDTAAPGLPEPAAAPFASTQDDLGRRIDGLARMVAAVRGRVDEEILEPADTLTTRVAERLRLSGEHTIVALAGATGSGKSSLFNALSDMELAGTGVRRPTTSWALACAWGPDGAEELLEWMGIPARHQVSRRGMLETSSADTSLEGLVLLDLPDHDSTEVAHHLEMDRLVRYSDLLIWVLDPQKYADAAIHERYIRPMAAFSEVTLVVLNQIDKLPYEQRDHALADVQRLAVADGLQDVTVLGVSATRGDGLDELKRELASRIRAKSAARTRLMADIGAAAETVADVAGVAEVAPLTPDRRQQMIDELVDCAGVSQLSAAIATSTRRRARRRTGWPVARWLGRLRKERSDERGLGAEYSPEALARADAPEAGPVQRAGTELVVRQLVDGAAGSLGRPWRRAVREAVGGDGEISTALDDAIRAADVTVARVPLWWRAVHLIQWLLLLGVVAAGAYALAQLLDPRVDLPFEVPDIDDVGGVPIAAVVAVGCLVGGLVLGIVSRVLTRFSARRRARRAETALRASIAEVAQQRVLAPVERVLSEYEIYREGLLTAQGSQTGR
jgi:GTP-binding protein EngB required for normal cell division